MSFIVDKQTLDDLNILGQGSDSSSIFEIYNHTHTRGGAQLLEQMFRHPLDDIDKIRKRSSIINYFQQRNESFPFNENCFDAAEYYLSITDTRTQMDMNDKMLQVKLQRLLNVDTELQLIHKGILSLLEIMNALHRFIANMESESPEIIKSIEKSEKIKIILNNPELSWVKGEEATKKMFTDKLARYDRILRYSCRTMMYEILEYTYTLDVYISIAQIANIRGFVRAQVLPANENILAIKGIYHPLIENAVGNDLYITSQNNVIFLTGANMAGKSTFMKAFSIAVFLAHVGLPVPAKEMTFSIRNGIYTTINLADNLNLGYSHFYSEVLRVKKTAQSIKEYTNMIIVFDELFRGTNVKDAYDATVAITEAFASIKDSIFLISTHIIEAGFTLKDNGNIDFIYLPTKMIDSKPIYPYTLEQGITSDRHGMMIIRNEGILDLLKDNPSKASSTSISEQKDLYVHKKR